MSSLCTAPRRELEGPGPALLDLRAVRAAQRSALTDIHVKTVRERIIRLLGTNVQRNDVFDAIELIAYAHPYNPLAE